MRKDALYAPAGHRRRGHARAGRRRRRQAGARRRRALPRRARRHRRRPRAPRGRGAREPRAVVNCAAWTDVDGAEAAEAAATAVNGEGAGNVARAAAETRRAHRARLDRLRLRRRRATRAVGGVRRRSSPLGAYGRSKLAGERAGRRGGAPSTRSCARPGSSAPAGATSSTRCCALGAERDEVSVVDDQVGSPTWTGHLAAALRRARRARGDAASCTSPAAARCSWYELAVEVFDRAGAALPRAADDVRPLPAPGAAPRVLACSAPSATTRPCCRRGRTGWRPI